MEKELTYPFEQLLREQRKNYLMEFRKAEDSLDSISEERESEVEEHGQEEQTARLLARLDDRTLHAIQEIDAALQRILDGVYGVCQTCAEAIPALVFTPCRHPFSVESAPHSISHCPSVLEKGRRLCRRRRSLEI
jgi:RNA polymerase-binding transcription factor DksA